MARILPLDIALEIGKNALMAFPALRKRRLRRPRTAPPVPRDRADLTRYAFAALNEVLAEVPTIAGKSILEIGSGDHLASGLSFLAAGAASYTTVEPALGDCDGPLAREWYIAVRHAWEECYPHLPWPEHLAADNFPRSSMDRVTVIRSQMEAAADLSKYDIICSHYAAQHVSNISHFAQLHARHLSNNGAGIHKIGFSAQDCWSTYADPFLYLRFPEWLWGLMGSRRALPNRKRFHEYVDAFQLERLGAQTVSRTLFSAPMKRSTLARPFRRMPEDSIRTRCATLLVTRNGPVGSNGTVTLEGAKH
jgi:hypothetical protein